ncbi:MAG: hypothetical protein KAT17_09105 [Candidatus Aminicenantes bacterium]|nr:hypothetical protein [Candidatus Aminicenantes bacterium]
MILLNPVINRFAEYISSRIQKVGTIPISIWTKKYSNSIDTIKEYLFKNRAIALLQANIKSKSKFNPYMSRFRKGVAKIAQDLYLEKGLELPVTPVSIYGSNGLITPFKKISVNIGEHMTIGPYMDARNPVAEFTDALERRVAELLSVNEYGVRSKE